ncbi:hypothetical protein [Sphingomonas jaspsi]|uniref:hypothetical protein n=1 Tax=Sphingomonas jaspsi TaxID=392409 RepID=UPI0004BCBE71|nr:hypothetical protein [Sphingomonas jaspsi]
MRKVFISAALAASTLAVAAPAAAQWAPPQPQGYAYGYNNYGQARRLQARVDNLQRQIVQLDRRNILSNREAAMLMNESRGIEYRLRQSAYNGLNYRESRELEYRVARLENRIYREARDGNRYGNYAYNNNGYYGRDYDRDGINDRYDNRIGRDRDGRDDRWEDDHGRHHD